jgi:hypothetical protein
MTTTSALTKKYMKTKRTSAAILASISLLMTGAAHAESSMPDDHNTVKVEISAQTGGDQGQTAEATTSIETSAMGYDHTPNSDMHGNATSTDMVSEHTSGSDSRGNATSTEMRNEHASTTAEAQGETMSGAYRSAVATFVQSLLSVANREGGIGAEVRTIAQSQNDSASTTATAMAKVDAKGPLATFLFGSDYKNLGVIQSELATTTNNIDQLQSVIASTTDATDKATLTDQLQSLESQQASLSAYVSAHENVFSLFGWLNKLLTK